MPLDVPDGAACFVDANIFYYHFVETPILSDRCTLLLERVAIGKIAGYTSLHVLSEAVHKVMLAEAAAKFGLNRAGLVNWLQRHRARIAELTEFQKAAVEFLKMGFALASPDSALLEQAASLSREMGLLTNDALIVAMIRRHGITNLATNDDDFDNAANLAVWKPR